MKMTKESVSLALHVQNHYVSMMHSASELRYLRIMETASSH